jgi:hypothetical protein
VADTGAGFTPPEQGKTTIDDKLFFEPERLSYESANEIAKRIAAAVKEEVKGRCIVIARTSLLADFANLNATDTMLRQLQLEYQSLADHVSGETEEPPREEFKESTPFNVSGEVFKESIVQNAALAGVATAAAAAIGGPVAPIVGAALGLAALLKQDVEYHGEQTSVDALAFEISLANDVLVWKASKVFIPDLAILEPRSDDGSLRALLAQVQNAKSRAWTAVGPLIAELAGLERDLDQAALAKDQKQVEELSSKISAARRSLDPLALPLERADQRFSDIQTQWAQMDNATGMSLLARMLRAESLHALGPLYLHASVVCSGGHNRISRNLFRLVGLSDGLSFVGAAIVRWAALSHDGSIQKGGLFTQALKSTSVRVTQSSHP